ncbi:uncharacterized protein [Polyergus mexicanus]|uniref:uncharacterized protein n=1 Tax=Polyergus mexicanus TaxID=615972 RepID=UPI0038B61852
MSVMRSPQRDFRSGQNEANSEREGSVVVEASGEGSDEETFATPADPVATVRGHRRGRPINLERLGSNSMSSESRNLLYRWQQSAGANSSESLCSEGEKTGDDKKKRERAGEEAEKGNESKKVKTKKRTPERDRDEGNMLQKLKALIKGFREETCGRLNDMKRQGEQIKEEVRKVRQKWEEWDKLWKGEKEKVWNKLESIESRQRENEEDRKKDLKLLEERVSKLELKKEPKVKEKGSLEEARESEVVKQEQNERWCLRLIEVERRMEGEERTKRKKNIIVKGLKADSEKGEKEFGKMMRDIGAQVKVEGIRRLEGKKEGKEGMLLVNLGSEEDKYEVMEKKKLLKGRNERIEEDLTWRERRRKWLIGRKA